MRPTPAEVRRLVPGGRRALAILPLHGDGSARRFYRVRAEGASFVLLEGRDPAENGAYVRIARHLADRRIRVPEICGVDPERGWILLEDLGDRSLFAALRERPAPVEIPVLYQPVLELLCRMQVLGAEGYDSTIGCAETPYGVELMVEGEGLYFAREFAAGLLGLDLPGGYRPDIESLAQLGGRAPARYFLHRDFQSRNIHLTPHGPAVIDFQGARHGPLAYDAAALILDPYAGLDRNLRARLLEKYLKGLGRLGVAEEGFQDAWFALGTFRLLQALGAFAKLGGRLGKPGFLEHAAKGLATLLEHLGERGRREYPAIWATVSRCRDAWARGSAARRGLSLTPGSE